MTFSDKVGDNISGSSVGVDAASLREVHLHSIWNQISTRWPLLTPARGALSVAGTFF